MTLIPQINLDKVLYFPDFSYFLLASVPKQSHNQGFWGLFGCIDQRSQPATSLFALTLIFSFTDRADSFS